MKKKVYREMYGIDVQKEREIMDNLWAKRIKKVIEETKEEKKTTKKKVGK